MSYSYDNGSQLTGINYTQSSTMLGSLTYSYDLAGRRINAGGTFAGTGLPQAISTTEYDAANELTQWGTATPTYDNNGNILSDGTNSYVWNARNQLVSMNSGGMAFQYDAFGRRVAKTNVAYTTNYLYDGVNPAQELAGATPTANVFAGRLDEYFQRTDSTGTSNFLTDALGNTLALTDGSGNPLAQYTYEPFGNTTITGSSSNPYEYTGRENDGTGVYFYRTRYYNPTFQRFLSEDPFGFSGISENLYAYALNSPENFTDPDGECPWCIIVGIGAVAGGAVGGIEVYQSGGSFWQVVGGVGRGAVSGAAGTAVGLAVGFGTGNAFAGGAAGAAVNSIVNGALGGNFSWSQFASDTALGGFFGSAAEAFGPTVRGGSNFNPWTSPRTFGPKAAQAYANEAAADAFGAAKDLGGRKNEDNK
jgi:RHS repeat-associated protein